jgi:taurine dioxygenase
MALQIRRLSNSLGAEIVGFKIAEPMSDALCAEVRQAFLDHCILLFRDQDITPEQHIAFTRRFGEIDMNDAVPDYRHPDHAEMVLVSNEAKSGKPSPTRNLGQQWHSDHSQTTRPTLGSLLHAQVVPEVGGDTMFTNMYVVWETLSPTLQVMLEPLSAIHDISRAKHLQDRGAEYLARKRLTTPPIVQPVVRIHSETGRKALYVNEMMVQQFLGMTPEESTGLLQYLFAHSVRPEFTYRHQWRRHDLIMWDNRCTMHNALADYDHSSQRTMYRTALHGEPCGQVYAAPLAQAA